MKTVFTKSTQSKSKKKFNRGETLTLKLNLNVGKLNYAA